MHDDVRLRVVPLGGLGHIGGNMMVYETADDLLVVDCGVLFPTSDQPGVDYIIPDVTYVRERRDKLRGVVLTHGHEDHIGALPYVYEDLDVPLYATCFTLDLLRNKFGEHPHLEPDLRLIKDREPFSVAGFHIDPIPVTHSIPHAVALAIETPIGRVLHTGDFKIDPEPGDGRLTDLDGLRALGDDGIVAMFSDSTNSERSGQTWSEREVADTLDDVIGSAKRRVIITTFSSNLHRLQAILDASHRAGRKVIPVGRSVTQNIQLGIERGYLKAGLGSLRDPGEYDRLPAERVTVVASGSQGEPRSAMTRIAAGRHGHIHVEPGDRVILSSRRIPGNERAIGKMVNNLWRLGAEVIDDRIAKVHTSGHAFNDEQRKLLDLARPRFFVPMHGEYRHLVLHAGLARDAGVDDRNICVVEDGVPVEFYSDGDTLNVRRGPEVPSGHVFVDGKGIGDVGEIVLRDRRVLSETGMVICVLIRGEDGTIIGGPDIITRGVIHVDANPELIEAAADAVRAALAGDDPCIDTSDCAEQARVALRRFFRRELDRRPLILPVVMQV